MLGGFLGAGKTTTLLKLALSLQRKGLRVGLITNDQASGLVDSALAEELNLPVREIAGGCFCCRSESLVEALDRLETHSKPQVFLAEPVGSCTDLVATVSLPLERIYQKGFVMAPYAVVVDPYRAMQSLGVEGELLFSPDVNYIYRKQLEEAEIIVINKVDVISPERLAGLRAALEREYPETRIMEIASREGTGVEALFDILGTETGKTRQVMEMDYERYAVGEALLGWVNIQGVLEAAEKGGKNGGKKSKGAKALKSAGGSPSTERDANAWLMAVAGGIAKRLRKRGIEVAHLKLSLTHGQAVEGEAAVDRSQGEAGMLETGALGRTTSPRSGGMAAVHWVRSDIEPELTRKMERPWTGGRLLINLRAEADPDVLAADTFAVLADQLEDMRGL
jgi:G3E family GTPase